MCYVISYICACIVLSRVYALLLFILLLWCYAYVFVWIWFVCVQVIGFIKLVSKWRASLFSSFSRINSSAVYTIPYTICYCYIKISSQHTRCILIWTNHAKQHYIHFHAFISKILYTRHHQKKNIRSLTHKTFLFECITRIHRALLTTV